MHSKLISLYIYAVRITFEIKYLLTILFKTLIKSCHYSYKTYVMQSYFKMFFYGLRRQRQIQNYIQITNIIVQKFVGNHFFILPENNIQFFIPYPSYYYLNLKYNKKITQPFNCNQFFFTKCRLISFDSMPLHLFPTRQLFINNWRINFS